MTRCKCGRFIESGFVCCFCFKDSGDLYANPDAQAGDDFWRIVDEPELSAEELIEDYEEAGSDDT